MDNMRRFGVELEINAFNGLDRPTDDTKLPEGIHYVGNLVAKTLGEFTEIRRWGYTHWDKSSGYWVVKPDGSCGMEICSPIIKGRIGIESVCRVVDAFANDIKIQADNRCSLHLHVDVSDLHKEQIANIITYWIKCEPVFMDSVPNIRKNNKYCQFIGLWDWLKINTIMGDEELIKLLGKQKYLTLNTYHLAKGSRHTLEFRIAEAAACTDSYFIKNWIKLILHFVECVKSLYRQRKYVEDDPWSSFLWLDPIDVFKILNFNKDMDQVRNWFLARLYVNIETKRCVASEQVKGLVEKFGINIEESLYAKRSL